MCRQFTGFVIQSVLLWKRETYEFYGLVLKISTFKDGRMASQNF
jgi:hypothetical protein